MAQAPNSKTWLVTGASQGIGLAITMSALHAGHKVVAGARNPETASENHPEVEAAGGRWLRLDVDSTQTTEIVKKAAEDAGGVDVVVNNAGSFSVGTVEDSEEEEMQAAMNTNFWGPVRVLKGVLPSMRARKTGTIVAISSIFAIYPLPASFMYCCPKAAQDMLLGVLKKELEAFNIRTVTLNAGLYRTAAFRSSKPPAISEAYLNTKVGQILGVVGQIAADPEANMPGDPSKLGDRLVEIVDGSGLGKRLGKHSRFLVGRDAIKLSDIVLKEMEEDFRAARRLRRAQIMKAIRVKESVLSATFSSLPDGFCVGTSSI